MTGTRTHPSRPRDRSALPGGAPPAPPLALAPWTASLRDAVLAATLSLLLAACSSKPPPQPPPRTVAEAERLARQAARLQAEENWTGAADWWQRAGRQYQLLHRRPETALAQHNEAAALRALGRTDAARLLLESAATANQELTLTNAWWRNQIALLQLDNGSSPEQAASRLARLEPRLGELQTQPALLALLHHETARAHLAQGRHEPALAAADLARVRYQDAGDPVGIAAIALTRARILQKHGDPAAADAWREALAAFESLGHPRGIAFALAGLGASLAERPDSASRALAAATLERAIANLRLLRLTAEAEAALEQLERLRKGSLPAVGKPEETGTEKAGVP